MLKAILFDLGDTLFDFEPMNRSEVFETAGRKTYDFLASMGHSLPPFKRYYKSQVWIVRWAYLWSVLRRREFNYGEELEKNSTGKIFYFVDNSRSQSRGRRKSAYKRASGVPACGCQSYSQRASGGSDIRIDSVRPPDCSPNDVPRSYTRLNST